MSITTRRPKWHPTPPPPPSPKILNLPRRTRRHKQPKPAAVKPPFAAAGWNQRGMLVSLFDQEERGFSGDIPVVLLNSRERVEEDDGGSRIVEEKWRFQAEILRAECNFLRMERDLALKKLERNRAQMERTLCSALHTLLSGRKKTYHGKNVSVVLEEKIEDLAEKLLELQRGYEFGEFEVRKCNNFDKKSSLLQRRLQKLGGLSDENILKEIPLMAESSCRINQESTASDCKSTTTRTNGEKMEGISKGMLERMEEEFGSMISATATPNSSVSNSKRLEFPDSSSFSTQLLNKEEILEEDRKCSGRCKAIVRRVVEQVRAEMDQWSQMQEMLRQVRIEMEDLQSSRNFWEDRALDSDSEIQSLLSSVEEWKHKALNFEAKANELETEVSLIKMELENMRTNGKRETATNTQDSSPLSLGKHLEKEKRVLICRLKGTHDVHTDNKEVERENSRIDLPLISLGKQIAKEKRDQICRLKENRHNNASIGKYETFSDGKERLNVRSNVVGAMRRSPLRDIGNSSPLVKSEM